MAAEPRQEPTRLKPKRRLFRLDQPKDDAGEPPRLRHPRRKPVSYRRIAVCLSPSQESAKAVHVACALLAEQHARIIVIAAIEVPRELPLNTPDPQALSAARDAVHSAQSIADSYGVSVERVILYARDAAEAVVADVAHHGCDLVVIASQWPRRQGHVRPLGRTVDYILKHAPCRVMLLGPSQAQATDTRIPGAEPIFPSSRPQAYWPTGDFIDRDGRA
jgi:nucleotide-binding universal stress UspA family protein